MDDMSLAFEGKRRRGNEWELCSERRGGSTVRCCFKGGPRRPWCGKAERGMGGTAHTAKSDVGQPGDSPGPPPRASEAEATRGRACCGIMNGSGMLRNNEWERHSNPMPTALPPPPPIPPRDGGAKHNARVEISRESTHTQASTPVVTCDHFTTVCLVRCYFFKSLAGTLGVMLLEYYG